MPPEIRRAHATPTEASMAPLLPLDNKHRDALQTADAIWTFWAGGVLVGFAAVRARTLPARRTIVARFTAVHATPTHDVRALRAAAARAYEAEVARKHPGLSCLWTSNAPTETRMSPRARAAAGDAIAVLSAHLAWAGLQNSSPMRRVS